MPAPKKGARFGGDSAHQRAMLANLAAHLIVSEQGAITTTEAKAKALRPYVEKLVTKAKDGGLHKQRQVVATIHDKDAAHRLFVEIGPKQVLSGLIRRCDRSLRSVSVGDPDSLRKLEEALSAA